MEAMTFLAQADLKDLSAEARICSGVRLIPRRSRRVDMAALHKRDVVLVVNAID